LPGWAIAVVVHYFETAGVLEYGKIEVDRILSVVIEPENRRNAGKIFDCTHALTCSGLFLVSARVNKILLRTPACRLPFACKELEVRGNRLNSKGS